MRIEFSTGIAISFYEAEYQQMSFTDDKIVIISPTREQKIIMLPNSWTNKTNQQNAERKPSAEVNGIKQEEVCNKSREKEELEKMYNDQEKKSTCLNQRKSPPKQAQPISKDKRKSPLKEKSNLFAGYYTEKPLFETIQDNGKVFPSRNKPPAQGSASLENTIISSKPKECLAEEEDTSKHNAKPPISLFSNSSKDVKRLNQNIFCKENNFIENMSCSTTTTTCSVIKEEEEDEETTRKSLFNLSDLTTDSRSRPPSNLFRTKTIKPWHYYCGNTSAK